MAVTVGVKGTIMFEHAQDRPRVDAAAEPVLYAEPCTDRLPRRCGLFDFNGKDRIARLDEQIDVVPVILTGTLFSIAT
jgi:hypothetical protein